MTFIVADRVQETTNSPGTGTATLLGAVSGYQSFSTGVGINNTTFYVIADQLGTNWEVGLGALNSTGTVLTRTTVYSSSNGGSTVNFATGTQYVWCDYPSSKAVIQGNPVNFSSIGATTAGTGAFTTLSASSTVSGAGFSNYFAAPPTIGNTTPNAGTFTTLVATSITDSGLTSGRVTYAGTGGLLQDSANLTFNGTTLTANTLNLTNALTTSYGGTGLTSFTAGDLPYYSTGTALSKLAIGTNGYILQSNGTAPTWVNPTSVIGGAGGSNTQVQYNSSGLLAGSANLTFNGTTLTTANDASISGLTVGKGGGSLSTSLGYQAGNTGSSNYGVMLGYQAGYSNTDVSAGNVMAGYKAGYANTSGGVTAVGAFALTANTTALGNSAFGNSTLIANTTGALNSAFGQQALASNTTASSNTAVGYQAGYSCVTGTDNTFIGRAAGNATTGTYNTFVGRSAGELMTGSKNTVIGAYYGNVGGLNLISASNYIVLSDGDGNPRFYIDSSGQAILAGTTTQFLSVGTYNATTGASANMVVNSVGNFYRSTSALKYKQDVRDLPSIDINKFRPVVYKSKCENDDKTIDHFGVIADEVDEAGIKELVTYGADGEVEGFQYERLTVVLLKAIQELKAEFDAYKAIHP